VRPGFAIATLALLGGCSGAANTSTEASFNWGDAAVDYDAHRGATTGPSGGGVRGGDPPPTPPWSWQDASTVDCPPSAKLVYVTGPNAELYSFDPPALTFAKIGTITCTSAPSHMTVDRHGIAWVVSAGKLYRVSTTNAECAEVTTWKPNATLFPDFALTFLGTTAAADDALYMLGQGSELLATFNATSGAVTSIGTAKLTATLGDMTSDGDGKLYLLADADPRVLVELDPTSAKSLASYDVNAAPVSDQALAYYGGSFYIFEDTLLFRYDVSTTKQAIALGAAPISVTGAGQSPCVR
jgi:hypothetical protein